MNVAACAAWGLLAAVLAAGAGLASAGGHAARPAVDNGAEAAQANAAAAGAVPAPRSVARTQVCTVHKELRIGDYVVRHETCRDTAQTVAGTRPGP